MTSLKKLSGLSGLGILFFCISTNVLAKTKPIKPNPRINNHTLQQAYNRLLGSSKKATKQIRTSHARLIQKRLISRKNHNKRINAVQVAKRQLRKKYRWGGTNPRTGFDCSGLTQYAYKTVNIKLPRTANAQYKHTKRIPLSKLQTGDLIFFHTRRTRARVNHVGIYLGGGRFIHAPRKGKRVSVAKLNNYWRRKAVAAGRV